VNWCGGPSRLTDFGLWLGTCSSAHGMSDTFQPKKFQIPTVLKGRINVICPICQHDEFLSVTPDIERAKKEGFQHVIVGVFGETSLAAQVVRFQHCANCGYVLNFLIGRFSGGDKQ
jgi:hypothetical protein